MASFTSPFAKNHGLVPSNIGIMLVDEDPTSLLFISTLLISCHYKVETFISAIEALATLSERIGEFDLVIIDIYLNIMPSVQLIQRIKRDFKIPIITMGVDGDRKFSSVAIDSGTWYYHLVKPITITSFEVVWQKAWKNKGKGLTQAKRAKKIVNPNIIISPKDEGISEKKSIKEVGSSSSKKFLTKYKRKKICCEGEETNAKEGKRPHLKWEKELHQRFLVAVRLLGELAIPKNIIDMMNVEGLTVKQVASHLQKHRLRVEKREQSHKTDQNVLIHGLPPSLRTQFPISFGPKQAPVNTNQIGAMLTNANSKEGNAKLGQQPVASDDDNVDNRDIRDIGSMEKNTTQDPVISANDEWHGLEEFLGIGKPEDDGKEISADDGIGSSTDFPSDDEFDFDFDLL